MSNAVMSLTDTAIRTAKPGAKPSKLYGGWGLYLIVTPNGHKWWRLRYIVGAYGMGESPRPCRAPTCRNRSSGRGARTLAVSRNINRPRPTGISLLMH